MRKIHQKIDFLIIEDDKATVNLLLLYFKYRVDGLILKPFDLNEFQSLFEILENRTS